MGCLEPDLCLDPVPENLFSHKDIKVLESHFCYIGSKKDIVVRSVFVKLPVGWFFWNHHKGASTVMSMDAMVRLAS